MISTMPNPKPTDADKKNYSYSIKTSPFHDKPGSFLRLGQKVQAKFRIFYLPHKSENDWGWVSAEAGEQGEVVHVQDGYWPTVRFEKTGCATCVTDLEVVALCSATYKDNAVTRECQRGAGHALVTMGSATSLSRSRS